MSLISFLKKLNPGLILLFVAGLGLSFIAWLFEIEKFKTTLVYHAFLFLISFLLVEAVPNIPDRYRNDVSGFFAKFNFSKGLALLFLLPAFQFYKIAASDIHAVLYFPGSFFFLFIPHLALLFIVLLGFVYLKMRLNTTKPESVENAKQLLITLLTGKGFFKKIAPGWFHRLISIFVGAAYLSFFYLFLFVLVTPFWKITKTIRAVSVFPTSYLIGSKSRGAIRVGYCLIRTSNNLFAVNYCPTCTRRSDSNVKITHHIFDYVNRNINSVDCAETGQPPSSSYQDI